MNLNINKNLTHFYHLKQKHFNYYLCTFSNLKHTTMNFKTLFFLSLFLTFSFSVFSQDSDGDGLTDDDEINIYNTDPLDPDTDDDDLDDGQEVTFWGNDWDEDADEDGILNILDDDSDNDTLLDGEEVNTYSTNPANPDSDSDGLLDGDEINIYNTYPLDPDTDDDGLTDGEEVITYSTNPLDFDTDDDGLGDYEEISIYLTDPLNEDTDTDNLTDGDEVNIYLTNPANPDTDNGGVNDGDEVLLCSTDPLNPTDDSEPTITEIDVTSCDSYTSDGGITYYESGTYTETIPDPDGCYTLLTINLTITTLDVSVNQEGNTLTAYPADADYQWIDCDAGNSIIPGENGQTFTATENGNYAVIVSGNSCEVSSDCYMITSVQIEQQKNISNINIYPIPSKGELTIDFSRTVKKISINITDITGKIVYYSELKNEHKINFILIQPAGFYMLNIKTDNEILSRKIILE